ncbi:uncharacterized protein BT62DRAFT_1049690 [Guyanagaster necrorhizus]|uniref:Uncharacterized protein n=1 Tax=Guyanagaster necrorhizus TaxID=856835 RepID=A0A9P7VYE0_9AGAR|nr:uncharacterized protein BT62DRAFT_1049690 [Guyanagaster necrorhizus MCA 3950]KAG7449851.1 hypothetical protein BT62DRAFT_1049690 [Guyanagaster necrorhizus MCA 3950]
MDLVHRVELVSPEEAEKIGLDTALEIQRVRERFLRSAYDRVERSNNLWIEVHGPSFDPDQVKNAIENAFKKVLEGVEADGSLFYE